MSNVQKSFPRRVFIQGQSHTACAAFLVPDARSHSGSTPAIRRVARFADQRSYSNHIVSLANARSPIVSIIQVHNHVIYLCLIRRVAHFIVTGQSRVVNEVPPPHLRNCAFSGKSAQCFSREVSAFAARVSACGGGTVRCRCPCELKVIRREHRPC